MAHETDLYIVANRPAFSFNDRFISKNALSILKAEKRLEDKVEALIAEGRSPDEALREAFIDMPQIHPYMPPFGDGGLVQAMVGLLKKKDWNTTWISSSMDDKEWEVANGMHSSLVELMESYGAIKDDLFPCFEADEQKRIRFKYSDYDFNMEQVFFESNQMLAFYDKIANGFFWPMMHLSSYPLHELQGHGFPKPRFDDDDFDQYKAAQTSFVNRIFDQVWDSYRSGKQLNETIVWNQDYHLLEVSRKLKRRLRKENIPKELKDKIYIGQFVHTPFPSASNAENLVEKETAVLMEEFGYDKDRENPNIAWKRVLKGLLGNDFVGFHTQSYCKNAVDNLCRFLNIEDDCIFEEEKDNRTLYVVKHAMGTTVFASVPIGIDVDNVLEKSKGKIDHTVYLGGRPYDLETLIKTDKRQKRLIFGGLERCDYTKGLPARIDIHKKVLEKLEAEGKDGRLYQITAPSRMSNVDYQDLARLVNERTDEANRDAGRGIIYNIDKGIPAPQNYRFMREVDVMYVTPLSDGMNLVALEYIAAQSLRKEGERGMLVLGNCGAAETLLERFGDTKKLESMGVVIVDPLDAERASSRVADAISGGYRITDSIIDYVKSCRVDIWAEKNMELIKYAKDKYGLQGTPKSAKIP